MSHLPPFPLLRPLRSLSDRCLMAFHGRADAFLKALNIVSWLMVVAWCGQAGIRPALTAAVFYATLTVLYLTLG